MTEELTTLFSIVSPKDRHFKVGDTQQIKQYNRSANRQVEILYFEGIAMIRTEPDTWSKWTSNEAGATV